MAGGQYPLCGERTRRTAFSQCGGGKVRPAGEHPLYRYRLRGHRRGRGCGDPAGTGGQRRLGTDGAVPPRSGTLCGASAGPPRRSGGSGAVSGAGSVSHGIRVGGGFRRRGAGNHSRTAPASGGAGDMGRGLAHQRETEGCSECPLRAKWAIRLDESEFHRRVPYAGKRSR